MTTIRFERTRNSIAHARCGDGPALVLCHGGSGSWNHWIRNIEALGERFDVIALDLPGFGESMAPPLDIPIADYIALVVDALDELLGEAPMHLSGFSFGSFVAARVAVERSPRVERLSLIGPSGFAAPKDRPLTLVSLKALRDRLGRTPTAAEERELYRHNLGQLMIWDREKIDDEAVALHARNVRNARFNSRRLSWSGEMPAALARLSCPTRVIHGEHDPSAFPSMAHRVAEARAALPSLAAEVIPACGHWAMYEAPEETNRRLVAFHGEERGEGT